MKPASIVGNLEFPKYKCFIVTLSTNTLTLQKISIAHYTVCKPSKALLLKEFFTKQKVREQK